MAIVKYPVGSLGDVNEGEKRLIKFLEVHLSDDFTLIPNLHLPYTNPKNNQVQILEYDMLVIAPHGIFNIENKDWGGQFEGDDDFWYVNGKERRNPHKTTAWKGRVLNGFLKEKNRNWGRAWIHSMVTISSVHQTLQNIYGRTAQNTFLLNDSLINFLDDSLNIDKDYNAIEDIQNSISDYLTGAHSGITPAEKTRILDFEVVEILDQKQNYAEYLVKPLGVSSSIRYRLKEFAIAFSNLPLDEREKQKNIVTNQYQALRKIKSNPFILNVEFRMDDESHTFYEISEFQDENTLQSEMLRKTFTEDEKWQIIENVITAVKAAHEANVFHRDINPQNIFLTNSYATLGNFGKSYFFDHQNQGFTVMRSISENNLSPYHALELISSDAGRYSDIYSLGVLVYHLFTEKLPTKDAIELNRLGGRLPSNKLPSGISKLIPSWLDELCNKTIRTNPEERWDNVDELESFIKLKRREQQESSMIASNNIANVSQDDFGELKPGKRVGVYSLLEELGKGGFSRVFRAQHSLQGKDFAMKIFNESVDAQSVVKEYEALKNLDHENIVKFEWNDQLPSGQFYTVMEFIDGDDLKKYAFDELRLPTQKIYKVAHSILNALVYMQDRAEPLFHRDIKPNNIFWDKKEDRFVLIDFNVASDTGNNDWVGTAPYIAPDLAKSSQEVNFDTSADPFALGTTIYNLVCNAFPWKNRMPILETAPTRPEIHNPSISKQFADFIYKSVQPKKENRFSSAKEMLSALLEIGETGLLQKVKSPKPTGISKDENLKIVDYINSLYSQSRYGNVGTRARMNPIELDRLTYSETKLDNELIPAILDGNFRLVIITGNAGDGKTAFIKNIEDKASGAKSLTHQNGAEFMIKGIPFLSNYDGSQDQANRANDEVLNEFFKPFANKNSFSNIDAGRVIAINEGRLVDFLQSSNDFSALADIISNYFSKQGEEKLPDGVLIINLNLRSVTVSNGTGSILRQQVQKLVKPELWGGCKDCSKADQCFIKYNVESLQDPAAGAEIISRLEMLVHAASLKREFHITIRDLRSFLAFLITRDHSCEDVGEVYKNAESNPYLYYKNFYFNLPDITAEDSGNEDRLVKLVRSLDVAQVPLPVYDRDLYFDRHKPTGFINFESRSFDLIELFNSQKKQLPAYEQKPKALRTIKKWHNLFSRHQYFEGKIDYSQRLPYHSLEKFTELLKKPDDKEILDKTLKGLAKAIAMNEGCDQHFFYDDKIILSSSHVDDPFSKSFRLFPLKDFELRVNNAEALANYLEYQPDSLILQHQKESHIKLKISLDLFEMLHFIENGFTPSVNDIKGQFVELEIFKNLLENLDYNEVIVTADNRAFFSIKKKEDLSLHLEKMEM